MHTFSVSIKTKRTTVCVSLVPISKASEPKLWRRIKAPASERPAQAPPTLLIAFANATAGRINELNEEIFHLKVRLKLKK